MKGIISTVVVSTLVTVFIIGAVEVGLRALKLFEPPRRVHTARPDLYVADQSVGYHLWPSTSTCDRYPATSPKITSLISNSDGFRTSREYGTPGSEKRILVTGDSFVFGMGVEAEDRFTEVLEEELSGWRVDNLGMTGWGIDLMVRALETFGPKAKPDVVVLSVYTDDFRRVLPLYAGNGFKIPKYELVDGRLVSVPYDFPSGWRRLHLAHAAYEIYWNRIADRNRYPLNEALLDHFALLTKQLDAKPMVIFLPGRGDTQEDRKRRAFLTGWAAAREIPYLDLTEVIHGFGVEKTYIKDNWHWNETGHRIAGKTLAKFLREQVGLSRQDFGEIEESYRIRASDDGIQAY